jgi:hypothetical protein
MSEIGRRVAFAILAPVVFPANPGSMTTAAEGTG